ncbi:hypothetical protein [Streptomyces brevispora]|uniref:DivIVA domain-containing protein n=1 Tax=Streptomyces brevispora TaxID=887462 RepID=A0ABZ1G4W4_9ACTN|nr:hypothetical protein [Streptomyces brevispora]WSC14356.1 hypothetical protein OIE64_16900 [Streptomyces brevispora]
MTEHKMRVIDGVRYRDEDVPRVRARAGAQAGPLTTAHADPPAPGPQEPDSPVFDPSEHVVLQVIAHLAEADEDETARVLDAEEQGEKRKSLVERREEFLAEARQRAAGGPGGGG